MTQHCNVIKKSFLWKFLVVVISLLLTYHLLISVLDRYKLLELENAWKGFENDEKGLYDFTVVTALFDIGRSRWWRQGRTYNEYLGYLMQILKLDVNLVVFIEPKGENFVRRIRKGREARTRVIPTLLSDLEYYPLLPRIRMAMDSILFQNDNSNYESGLPEATDPLYDLVTNSKTTLVHSAISHNHFDNDYFIWLDAGYGHGNGTLFPPDGIWHPRHLLEHPGQVTFIAFENLGLDRRKEAGTLYRKNEAWIAGGLFAGGVAAMKRFYHLHRESIEEFLSRGVIDDDQTIFVDCVMKDRDNFRPVIGDWYDLMRPFR